MDNHLLFILLSCLIFAVAMNFFLTFRLTAIIRTMPHNMETTEPPQLKSLPLGFPAPKFEAFRLEDGENIATIDTVKQPSVLVFLSSKCKACRSKLVDLNQMQNAMDHVGVALWLVSMEHEDQFRQFLQSYELLHRAVTIDWQMIRQLNPSGASPYYLFLDEHNQLQASGEIGNNDWQSFQQQMNDIKSEKQL